MKLPRASGILLHVTSLPGRGGIGALGPEARRFVDFLAASGQRYWQILPLGPTGWGHSPYQSLSAFAGNPLWLSLEVLVEEGLLAPSDLADAPAFPQDRVDYERVSAFKEPLLRRSFERFRSGPFRARSKEWEAFREGQRAWLADWGLFVALKGLHGGAAWTWWEGEVARRLPAALGSARRRLADEILYHEYLQYQFFRQWQALKAYAGSRGISMVGDVPIYVAHDSVDVWSHPGLFSLDERGSPTLVAGVPPDYFSSTGQRWGNPLYRWDALASSGYAWWVERLRTALALVDVVVLDHFRGFEAYWEVPATAPTAVEGRWVKGPGARFFEAVQNGLGVKDLPFIVEDLGVITPEVEALRDRFGLPGMRVLQFAFDGDPQNSHLPHNYPRSCVVYTGTHNNDTTAGWFSGLSLPRGKGVQETGQHALRYLGLEASDGRIHQHLARLALASVADLAMIPLQDLLGLGSEARMNRPGVAEGNWGWRYRPELLTAGLKERLRQLTYLYGRGL